MIFYILQDMSINYELTRGDAKGIYIMLIQQNSKDSENGGIQPPKGLSKDFAKDNVILSFLGEATINKQNNIIDPIIFGNQS